MLSNPVPRQQHIRVHILSRAFFRVAGIRLQNRPFDAIIFCDRVQPEFYIFSENVYNFYGVLIIHFGRPTKTRVKVIECKNINRNVI